MIIKPQKGRNEILLGLLLLIIILFGYIKLAGFDLLKENLREKVLTYDLGFSRWHNILDKNSNDSYKHINVFNRLPNILYSNIFGYERNKIEKLLIDIKFIDYQKILADRDSAIKNQILTNPTFVKAEITYRDKKYKAKVRLKGDLTDHWTSVHRLSLRINLKGENTIFGLNEFNIQKPRTRSFPYDAVFQDTLRAVGNLASEHNYVNVNVNGSPWGVMNLESHISKEFLERNKRKDSLIVRFSNEDGWFYPANLAKESNLGIMRETKEKIIAPHLYYRLSDPILFSKVYGGEKSFDRNKREIYTYIVEERIKKRENLYDVNTYSRLLLLSKLWGEMHSIYENNNKHYFNPYNLKLEPISSDQFPPKKLLDSSEVFNLIGRCPNKGYAFVMNEVYRSLKNTQDYYSELPNNYEHLISKLNLLDDFFQKQHNYFPLDKTARFDNLNNNLKTASSMNQAFFKINDQCVNKFDKKLLRDWKPSQYFLPKHVQAFHYDDGNISIFNLLPDKISLLGIRIDQDQFISINKEIPGHDNVSYMAYGFKSEFKDLLDDRIEVVTEYKGKIKYQKLYKTLVTGVENPLIRKTPNDFEFLIQESPNNWIIPRGDWIINSPMIVKGNLMIEPGSRLFFNHNAYLAINGALTANGSKDEKIILTSKNNSWMGLYIYESELDSSLNNVEISNMSSISDKLLKLSGGITFYKANVNIVNSIFLSSRSEDMLNIVESEFEIHDSNMMNSYSDALDVDFSNGNINNLLVQNVGGDAIDTSGANVNLSNIKVYNVMDKGVSAGEASIISISNCEMDNVGVGIASKDGSNVKVSRCFIKKTQLAALMSYNKKNFYNNPSLEVEFSNFESETKFIRQKNALLFLDKVLVPHAEINLDQMYSSGPMRK